MVIELFSAGARYLQSIVDVSSLFKWERKARLPMKNDKRNMVIQVSIGVVIFLVLAIAVFIPLLSSADATFGAIFEDLLNNIFLFFKEIFNAEGILKIVLTLVLTVGLLALGFYWDKEPLHSADSKSPAAIFVKVVIGFILFIFSVSYHPALFLLILAGGGGYLLYWNAQPRIQTENKEKRDLSVMIGVILGGVLILYLLFLGIQVKDLFMSSLPVNFDEAESLVKAGFWQLFALTIINILFYIGVYGKTNQKVQHILSAFYLCFVITCGFGHPAYLFICEWLRIKLRKILCLLYRGFLRGGLCVLFVSFDHARQKSKRDPNPGLRLFVDV